MGLRNCIVFHVLTKQKPRESVKPQNSSSRIAYIQEWGRLLGESKGRAVFLGLDHLIKEEDLVVVLVVDDSVKDKLRKGLRVLQMDHMRLCWLFCFV